jgi:hypothetical protein
MKTKILISICILTFAGMSFAGLSDILDQIRQEHVEGLKASKNFELLEFVNKDGVNFKNLNGKEKAEFIYSERILPTRYNEQNLPRLNSLVGLVAPAETLLPNKLAKAITRNGDEFEQINSDGTVEPAADVKTFHSFGSTAVVEFVAAPGKNNVGMYKGAWGLLRFSYAGPTNIVGNIPGMGLKLFVKGNDSQNLVAMHSLVGQGKNTNVFQNDFSNIFHLVSGNPDEKTRESTHPGDQKDHIAGEVMKLVEEQFIKVVGADRQTFYVQVDHLAKIDQDGNESADQGSVPTWLYFVPRIDLKNKISETDFRVDLAQIANGTPLYDVYSLNPASSSSTTSDKLLEAQLGNSALIGTIYSRSTFVASAYGDYRFFVKHKVDWMNEEYKGSAESDSFFSWSTLTEFGCAVEYNWCSLKSNIWDEGNCQTQVIQGVGSSCAKRRY